MPTRPILHRAAALAFAAAACLIGASMIAPVTGALALGDASDDGPRQTWAVVPATAEGPDGRAAFDYVVEPDDVYADFVAVRNLGDEELSVELYAQDAEQTLDNDFALLTPDDRAERVGAWVSLESTEVTVPPRSFVVVPFTIDVPAGAEPGDHAGGIVAVSTARDGEGARVQYRVGSRLQLRIAGPVDATLEVGSVFGNYENRLALLPVSTLDIGATFENTGNVRVSPRSEAQVTGLFGLWSQRVSLDDIAELLPGGAQTSSARMTDVPALGPLWVTVEVPEVISSGQDLTDMASVTTVTTVVWAMPWVLLVVIALLGVAIVVAIVNVKRRRRAEGQTAPLL